MAFKHSMNKKNLINGNKQILSPLVILTKPTPPSQPNEAYGNKGTTQ